MSRMALRSSVELILLPQFPDQPGWKYMPHTQHATLHLMTVGSTAFWSGPGGWPLPHCFSYSISSSFTFHVKFQTFCSGQDSRPMVDLRCIRVNAIRARVQRQRLFFQSLCYQISKHRDVGSHQTRPVPHAYHCPLHLTAFT